MLNKLNNYTVEERGKAIIFFFLGGGDLSGHGSILAICYLTFPYFHFWFDKTHPLLFFWVRLLLKLNSQYLLPEFCGRICSVVVGQCLVGCTVEGVEVVIAMRPRQLGGERVRQVEQSPSDDDDVPDVEPEWHDHGCVTNTFTKKNIKLNKSKRVTTL